MPALVPQTVDEAVETVRTTAPLYVRDFADLTMRKRLWMSLIKKYGRELFNQGAPVCVWGAKVRDGVPEAIDGNPNPTFSPIDRRIQFSQEWRGYRHGDSLTYKERLINENAGPSMLLNRMNAIVEDGSEDFAKFFNREIYIDGDATGNENRFHGRKSMLRYDASTCTGADKIAVPDGSYAGQSIELESNGGSWSADLDTFPNATLGKDWPEGSGTSDYDATSPLILNLSSSNWNVDGTTTWAENAEAILSYTNEIQSARGARKSRSAGDAPIVCLVTPTMKHEFEMNQRQRFQINVELKESTDLGFPDVYKYNGMFLASDFECPANEMHQLSPGTMEIAFCQGDYWKFDGPIDLKDRMKYVFNWYSYGNFRFQPKAECMGALIA